jgi:hypothetical protein
MPSHLAKTASILMAIVMAATTTLCRCGVAACHNQRETATVQHQKAIPPCANHCSDDQPRSPDGDGPVKCPDCEKANAVSERQTAAPEPVVQLNFFTTPAVDAILAPSASSRSINVRTDPLDPPIDVLLQTCILLI